MMINDNGLPDRIKFLKTKIEVYFDKNLSVHISKHDGAWLNGEIKEISNTKGDLYKQVYTEVIPGSSSAITFGSSLLSEMSRGSSFGLPKPKTSISQSPFKFSTPTTVSGGLFIKSSIPSAPVPVVSPVNPFALRVEPVVKTGLVSGLKPITKTGGVSRPDIPVDLVPDVTPDIPVDLVPDVTPDISTPAKTTGGSDSGFTSFSSSATSFTPSLPIFLIPPFKTGVGGYSPSYKRPHTFSFKNQGKAYNPSFTASAFGLKALKSKVSKKPGFTGLGLRGIR